MNQKILVLLARIPADHWGFDLAALVAAVGAVALVAFGFITPAQLPSLIDAATYGLGLIGVRFASLKAKAAIKDGLALVEAAKARDIPGALESAAKAASDLKVVE